MKKTLTVVALLAIVTVPAVAQTAAAPTPDWTLTGNAGLFSDYRFRGISQTNNGPALQGGIDWAHKTGFYLGNWNSNVDAAMYTGANLEMDFYGGWKMTSGDFGLDVGAYYYYYPGTGKNPGGSVKIDNTELYIGGSWKTLTLKYSYAISDFFAAPDSKGSSYLDLGYSYDFGNNFGLVAHYGYQTLKGSAAAAQIDGSTPDNVSDWKLGGTYTVDGWALGLAYVATNRNYSFGTASLTNKNVSNDTVVLSAGKTF